MSKSFGREQNDQLWVFRDCKLGRSPSLKILRKLGTRKAKKRRFAIPLRENRISFNQFENGVQFGLSFARMRGPAVASCSLRQFLEIAPQI